MLPQNCDLLHDLGTLYVKKREMDKALTQFETGIKTALKCGLNYNSAARMLIQQNRAPEAKQKLDALIKIAPTSDGAVIAKEILASIGKGA